MREPLDSRIRWLLWALAGLWLLLWVLVSHIEIVALVHAPSVQLWRPIVMTVCSTAVAVAWPIYWLRSGEYERISLDQPGRWFRRCLLRLPLLIVIEFVLVYGLRYLTFTALGAHYSLASWSFLATYEIWRVSLFYGLWLVLVFGVRNFSEWRQQGERLLGIQKALAEAQLAQLKAQLRPHFLFNTLNTISSLMQVDVDRADRLLARLADLLRASLGVTERDTVPLATELHFLHLYADIMRERFEGRVNVEWIITEEALNASVPAMLLQPLLENAYRHGVEASATEQAIEVRAHRDQGVLNVTIHNTGPQLAQGRRDGVGLRNCRERLRMLYGESASLSLADAGSGGVIASVSVPWRHQTQ